MLVWKIQFLKNLRNNSPLKTPSHPPAWDKHQPFMQNQWPFTFHSKYWVTLQKVRRFRLGDIYPLGSLMQEQFADLQNNLPICHK
jgi:hypothetical protein